MTTEAVENLQAAQQRAMADPPQTGHFPRLAATLHAAGVRVNEWNLPSAQSTWVTDLGTVVQQGEPVEQGTMAVPSFDEAELVRVLRADQNGEGTFPEFLAGCWKAGVIRYVVDLDAREVTYFGLDGASYTEQYPQAQPAA